MKIFDAIKAATPPPPPARLSIFSYTCPDLRRLSALARNGRSAKLEEMSRVLARATHVPEWIGRLAMDAVIPVDHEHELDCTTNDAAALARAVLAMGLNPCDVMWCASTAH